MSYITERRETAQRMAESIFTDALIEHPAFPDAMQAFIDTLLTESDGVEHQGMVRLAMYHRLLSVAARIIGE